MIKHLCKDSFETLFHRRFAVDIKPTKEVSEYTATIAYELLSEEEEKVDSLKMILSAEGKTFNFRKIQL